MSHTTSAPVENAYTLGHLGLVNLEKVNHINFKDDGEQYTNYFNTFGVPIMSYLSYRLEYPPNDGSTKPIVP